VLAIASLASARTDPATMLTPIRRVMGIRIGVDPSWFFILFLGFIRVMPSLSIVEVKEVLPHPLKHAASPGGHHLHPNALARPHPQPPGHALAKR